MKRSLFLVSTFVLSFAAHAGELDLKGMRSGTWSIGYSTSNKQFQELYMMSGKLIKGIELSGTSQAELNRKVISDLRLIKDGEQLVEKERKVFLVNGDNESDDNNIAVIEFFNHKIIASDKTERTCSTAIVYSWLPDVVKTRDGDISAKAYVWDKTKHWRTFNSADESIFFIGR